MIRSFAEELDSLRGDAPPDGIDKERLHRGDFIKNLRPTRVTVGEIVGEIAVRVCGLPPSNRDDFEDVVTRLDELRGEQTGPEEATPTSVLQHGAASFGERAFDYWGDLANGIMQRV